MSGHSKWSKVKHQKATTDVVKAASFTRASRGITLAVREGGGIGDPSMNFRLRLAIEKAKEVNMPKDNIERAISKGLGVGGGEIQQATYEAFGPAGTAFIIEAATDNKQRLVSQIKNILEHNGGTLVTPGAVSHMFRHIGIIVVSKSANAQDMTELALTIGAEDVREYDSHVEFITSVEQLAKVKDALEKISLPIETAQLVMEAINEIDIDEITNDKIEHLKEQLDTLDDIQNVFSNIIEK